MKIDLKKLDLALARACMNSRGLREHNISSNLMTTVYKGIDIKPSSVGRIAKALNVDPLEIIKED